MNCDIVVKLLWTHTWLWRKMFFSTGNLGGWNPISYQQLQFDLTFIGVKAIAHHSFSLCHSYLAKRNCFLVCREARNDHSSLHPSVYQLLWLLCFKLITNKQNVKFSSSATVGYQGLYSHETSGSHGQRKYKALLLPQKVLESASLGPWYSRCGPDGGRNNIDVLWELVSHERPWVHQELAQPNKTVSDSQCEGIEGQNQVECYMPITPTEAGGWHNWEQPGL